MYTQSVVKRKHGTAFSIISLANLNIYENIIGIRYL